MPPERRYFAGVDGGQSSTVAVIGDETGRVVGTGSAGPADEVGQSAASTRLRDALESAVAAALRDAHLDEATPLAHVVAGISGYEGTLRGVPPSFGGAPFELMHDAPVAHAGALPDGFGAIVIAGTGSVAYAKGAAGEGVLVGGWGYAFGDEGSAFWIARRMLAAAFRKDDEGQQSSFGRLALQALGRPSLRKLARSFYAGTTSRTQIAALASAVLDEAAAGNSDAAAIAGEAAAALAALAKVALARVNAPEGPVAFTGGLMRSAVLRAAIESALRASAPRVRMSEPQYTPAQGALLLAYSRCAAGVERLLA